MEDANEATFDVDLDRTDLFEVAVVDNDSDLPGEGDADSDSTPMCCNRCLRFI